MELEFLKKDRERFEIASEGITAVVNACIRRLPAFHQILLATKPKVRRDRQSHQHFSSTIANCARVCVCVKIDRNSQVYRREADRAVGCRAPQSCQAYGEDTGPQSGRLQRENHSDGYNQRDPGSYSFILFRSKIIVKSFFCTII